MDAIGHECETDAAPLPPVRCLPNGLRAAESERRVLGAAARLAGAGLLTSNRLAREAKVSKPTARAAVGRLRARGAWPYGDLSRWTGWHQYRAALPAQSERRVLEAAAGLAARGEFKLLTLARAAGMAIMTAHRAVARLRARGAWPYAWPEQRRISR